MYICGAFSGQGLFSALESFPLYTCTVFNKVNLACSIKFAGEVCHVQFLTNLILRTPLNLPVKCALTASTVFYVWSPCQWPVQLTLARLTRITILLPLTRLPVTLIKCAEFEHSFLSQIHIHNVSSIIRTWRLLFNRISWWAM